MKSRMLMMLLMLGLVVPSMSLAATKILLLDDIGSGDATFAFEKDRQGGVTLTARVNNPCWDPDCKQYLYYTTGLLKEFSSQDRAVYYNGGGAPVSCGVTQGILQGSQILPTCQVIVSPELVCSVWYNENDCARTATKYRVYMTIQQNPRAG